MRRTAARPRPRRRRRLGVTQVSSALLGFQLLSVLEGPPHALDQLRGGVLVVQVAGEYALVTGVVCVATTWPNIHDRKARFRLIWTQALHWATFLVIMNIMLLPGVQKMVPAPANSLVLLMLLALGTFLAGINLLSLEICFLGFAMALFVPAIAWLKQSALFLLLAAVLLVGLGITFWPRRRKNYTA